jgi:uncharacterized protein
MGRGKIYNKIICNPFCLLLRKAMIFPFILLIKLYQYTISPYIPDSCRFNPSCSNYSLEAFKIHGIIKGIILSAWRILRCNPWGGHGYDPIPPAGQWKSVKNLP